MIRALSLALLLIGTQPAFALSCLPPDVARDYLKAEQSPDVWIVVDGVVTFDEKRLPRVDPDRQEGPRMTDIPARINGHSLSQDGFVRRFDQAITLQVLCFGPWCGGAASQVQYLAFLKREAGGYVMIADPCGGRVYPDAAQAVKDRVAACFNGKGCSEAPLR